MGRAQGPDPRLEDPAHGRPRRGPPDRVLRLRGRHPGQAVRRRRRHRLGLGHLGAGGADARRPQGGRGRRAQVPAQRREAQGPLHDRPDQRPPGQRRAAPFEDDEGEQWLLIHKRDEHAVAGLGRRGPPAERQDRPDQRRGQGRTATRSGSARRRRRPPRSTSPARKPAPLPQQASSRCWRRSRPSRSATTTGCSRSSGTASGCRPWSTTARSGSWTRNLNDAATYFPRLLGSPGRWIEAEPGRSSTARSSRSTRTAGPTSACSRPSSATRRRPGCVYQAFDLLYLDGRSLLDVPLEDRKRLLRSVLKEHPRVRFASHVDRRGAGVLRGGRRARASRASSPSSGGRATSPAGAASAWLKIKIRPEQELVVGGWTPGEWQRPRPRRAGRRRLRGRQAAVRRQGRQRASPGAIRKPTCSKRLEPLVQDDPPFDPRAAQGLPWPLGRRPQGRHVGPARARDPRRARRLDARRPWSARRRTRASRPAATRRPSSARPRSPRPPRSVPPKPPNRPHARGGADAPKTSKIEGEGARRRRARPSSEPDVPGAPPSEELDALDALGKEGVWQVGGRELKLTNLDKPLFEPRDGGGPITKRELIRYFARIAPTMLPHLADRPLNLQRFPNGAGAPGFWQKDIPETAPKWLHALARDRRRRPRGPRRQRPPDRRPTSRRCAWLGNQASFEIHAWTGKLPEPWQPTFAYIDIDPGEKTTWEETLTLARLYRTALEHLGVRGYPKTTGKRGIQIWIPIVPRQVRLQRHERLGRAGVEGGRLDRAGPHLVGVGEGRAQGPRPARLHPERVDQDARRAVRRPAGAGRAGLARRSPGTSWTTRTCGPTAGRSATSSSASPRSATCSPPPRPTPRSCRRSEARGRLRDDDMDARTSLDRIGDAEEIEIASPARGREPRAVRDHLGRRGQATTSTSGPPTARGNPWFKHATGVRSRPASVIGGDRARRRVGRAEPSTSPRSCTPRTTAKYDRFGAAVVRPGRLGGVGACDLAARAAIADQAERHLVDPLDPVEAAAARDDEPARGAVRDR